MKIRKVKNNLIASLLGVALVFSFSSCKKDNTETPQENKDMEELVIPDDFGFETSQEVTIHFQDQLKAGSSARYDVFLHNPNVREDTVMYQDPDGNTVIDTLQLYDNANDLIASKISETGLFDLIVKIPKYITQLYVVKNEYGTFTSQIVQINQKSASFGSGLKSGNADPLDVMYGINIQSDLIQINPGNGSITVIDNLPNGGESIAIDKQGGKLYFVGKNSPNTLYRYDIATKQTTTVANLKIKTEGMDFNPEDGLLYLMHKDYIYKVSASTGSVLYQKQISGVQNKNGGDLSLGPNGRWYYCTFSGFYWLEFKSEKIYAHPIKTDLPFNPTGLVFDSYGDIWMSVKGNGRMVKMNTNGNWQYMFDPYVIGIDDLTAMPLEVAPVPDNDADDDGIIDFYDVYPTDPERAYNTFTPSEKGLGSTSFEDLWPGKGDYDFNDMVIQHHFTTVMNSQDKVVEVLAKITIHNVGASYVNGFGMQLPVSPAVIESVSGYNLTEDIVTLDGKGLETGQDKAVIIVFDNAQANLFQTLNLTIRFSEPQEATLVGTPPYNPFIFVNRDRGREVHLVNMNPTNKVNMAYFGQQDDRSNPAQGIYYRTQNNLPWAIDILDIFGIPKEGKSINKAYLKFNDWAESGGTLFPDWYKNLPSYRDESYLKIN